MRKPALSLLIIIAAAVLLGTSSLLWAQPPNIRIDLNFLGSSKLINKSPFYDYDDPVGVKLAVRNNEGATVWISKGFSSKNYYLQMRVIDPAKRLLIPQSKKAHEEFPDAPPLPFALHQGRAVRVAPCEELHQGFSRFSEADDLRNYYAMDLPGYYSAQVQLSAMVWAEEACDVNNYKWLGLLKSDMKIFYMSGSTKVEVKHKFWQLPWKEGKYPTPNIEVTIWPKEGKTVDDYDTESIRLNDKVPPLRVDKNISEKEKKHYLLAVFKNQDGINSLGREEVDLRYPVVISGRLKNGEFFGGGQRAEIVKEEPKLIIR